jgi:integrase
MLQRNPCDGVELLRMERKEMQALSSEEVTRFLNAATEDDHNALFALAVATGMRPEEYLALKWSDLDLEARTVTVTRTLVWRKGGAGIMANQKQRVVPILWQNSSKLIRLNKAKLDLSLVARTLRRILYLPQSRTTKH